MTVYMFIYYTPSAIVLWRASNFYMLSSRLVEGESFFKFGVCCWALWGSTTGVALTGVLFWPNAWLFSSSFWDFIGGLGVESLLKESKSSSPKAVLWWNSFEVACTWVLKDSSITGKPWLIQLKTSFIMLFWLTMWFLGYSYWIKMLSINMLISYQYISKLVNFVTESTEIY